LSPPHDAVVIGAGHNGLTCACYLADAGLKVMVLEQSHAVGGMTTTEEITFPGFKSDLHAFGYQFANLSPVPQELELASHGFELIRPEIDYSHVFPDGGIVSMHRHIDDTVKSIERYSKQDGRAWRELMEKFLRAKDGIAAWMNSPPASLASSIDRLACMPHGLDEYRFELQSLRSWCNETFEAEQTKLFLGAFACHASVAPDDVGGAHLAWLFTSIIQDMGNRAVKGGMHHLPLALASHLQSRGGEIRTDARVSRITVKGGKAVGVQLAGGEEITVSKVVASNADPRHLIVDLLGEQHVGAGHRAEDRALRVGRRLHGDLSRARWAAHVPCGRGRQPVRVLHPTPPTLEYLARIYAECRSGKLPAAPLVVMCNDSAMDPSRCPAGKAVVKLIVHNVPYEIKGDATGKIAGRTWDAVKEAYADHILDMVTNGFVPNLKERILKRVVHSPVDMERSMPSAVRGTVAHGAFLPYQAGALRPIPELGQYRTPVANVYLCGSGSHPGGGVSMAPGRNAAHVILADLEGR